MYITVVFGNSIFGIFPDCIQKLITKFKDQQSIIEECCDKLYYFLAHQARKVYLSNQYKARLARLDKDGAILVCDYKMRILPKSARETKEEFFGKIGRAHV